MILIAINQTDMLTLRQLSVGASVMGITYNLLQPKPLLAPAAWASFFILCHLYQIVTLWREQSTISLSRDQELAYERAFVDYGFTPRQFLDILEQASAQWHTFSRDAPIQQAGEEMELLHCALEGDVELLSPNGSSLRTVQPGKGGWLGEFFDPNQPDDYWQKPHPASVSWRCASARCRTLALNRRALHEALSSNPRLAHAAERAEIADLWGKLHTAGPQQRALRYRSMLEVALSDGSLTTSERKLLADFKAMYTIPQAEHDDTLRALGWSETDYERGHRSILRR